MAAAKKKTTKKTTAKSSAKKTAVKKSSVKSTKATKTAKSNELALKNTPVTEKQTQAQVISDLAEAANLEKKAVRNLFEALKNQIRRHLMNRGSGELTLPGLGIKVRRVNKKATKARKGVNPFTGEPMTIKAKPARKSARATALKALKDLV